MNVGHLGSRFRAVQVISSTCIRHTMTTVVLECILNGFNRLSPTPANILSSYHKKLSVDYSQTFVHDNLFLLNSHAPYLYIFQSIGHIILKTSPDVLSTHFSIQLLSSSTIARTFCKRISFFPMKIIDFR